MPVRPIASIEAAHALGAVGPRIIARHIIPNAGGTILVAATTVVSQSIVLVATVDYLGYGFNQTEPTDLTVSSRVFTARMNKGAGAGRAAAPSPHPRLPQPQRLQPSAGTAQPPPAAPT